MKNNTKPTIVFPKGRLYTDLQKLYLSKGIILPDQNNRRYFYDDLFDDCNIFIAKPKSIPLLLESKLCEFGFVGKDIMINSMCENTTILHDTNLNKIRIVLASKTESITIHNKPLIIATEYENIASNYFTNKGIPHYIINSTGSTEGFINIGANAIIDVCDTGESLKSNNLLINEILLESSTCLYSHIDICEGFYPNILQLLFNNK
ncbi:MAG: ATP phosphoribosyltransferase [Clostridia bacterium]